MSERAIFIDQLRKAAKNHKVVGDLLDLIERSVLIDDLGNRSVIGNEEDCAYIRAAQLANEFVRVDRGE